MPWMDYAFELELDQWAGPYLTRTRIERVEATGMLELAGTRVRVGGSQRIASAPCSSMARVGASAHMSPGIPPAPEGGEASQGGACEAFNPPPPQQYADGVGYGSQPT